jgi:glutathione synthase/RimK-type ligase-like ATP-grasp enzyme
VTDVLLATCAELPDGDEDGPALSAALTALGIRSAWCSWDDPAIDWARAPVVIRSTWDYSARRESFLSWAAEVPVLYNPSVVVGWNSDKTYLRDLARAGVPVVPSAWAAPGEDLDLPDAAEFVVKPSVGAGSRGAGRFRSDERAQARSHVAVLHAEGRTVMAQPYLADVDEAGETALIYVDGVYSHAIRKGPMLDPGAVHALADDGLYVQENISARDPEPAELAVGAASIGLLRERYGELLYARVDLLPSPDGPVVVELEVTEPSLFLGYSDGAAKRFAAAIAERV